MSVHPTSSGGNASAGGTAAKGLLGGGCIMSRSGGSPKASPCLVPTFMDEWPSCAFTSGAFLLAHLPLRHFVDAREPEGARIVDGQRTFIQQMRGD
jgi:hypothetical protein